jgi:methyl-accepting chemotaxis protein
MFNIFELFGKKFFKQLGSRHYWFGFKGRYVMIIAVGAIIIGTLMSQLIPRFVHRSSLEMFQRQATVLTTALFEAIGLSIEFGDYESIQAVFDKIGISEDIVYLGLKNLSTGENLSVFHDEGFDFSETDIRFADGVKVTESAVLTELVIEMYDTQYQLVIGSNIALLNQVNAKIRRTINLVVIVAIFIIIFAMIALVEVLNRPLNALIDGMRNVAEGEADLTRRLEFKGNDEFAVLSKLFNQFLERIQKTIQNINDSAMKVSQVTQAISASAEQMAAGAEEQQAQLSEVAASIEEMSSMILQTSQNATTTQSNASQASSTAGEGQSSVEGTVLSIQDIVLIVEDATKQIAELESQSQSIGDVIQVIDDIADQTNLLALNANIEAARAGDAGRGFAVVADEVRKLAERTVKATAEIGQKIKTIQNDVRSSVEAMNRISEQSRLGEKQAHQSGEVLRSIVDSIRLVNEAVTQIATATDEQSSGAEEISKNVEAVSTVSKEAASSSQSLASSAEELNNEVMSLNTLIGEFKF